MCPRAPLSPHPLSPGTLKLMEKADKLLWSVQVDHQLFALEKLDVTVRSRPSHTLIHTPFGPRGDQGRVR